MELDEEVVTSDEEFMMFKASPDKKQVIVTSGEAYTWAIKTPEELVTYINQAKEAARKVFGGEWDKGLLG
jgi:hypothetical protein